MKLIEALRHINSKMIYIPVKAQIDMYVIDERVFSEMNYPLGYRKMFSVVLDAVNSKEIDLEYFWKQNESRK